MKLAYRHHVADEPFEAFLPSTLPPSPALEETSELRRACSLADQMLGRLAASTGLSFNTVTSSLEILKSKGIVYEVDGRRGRLFVYNEYIRLMDEGALAG